ncbi:ABC transporter substrate-binding protein [Cutibacterium sp. WCA-380-WT-3A]|uniref:ABC transporter substrate-binding protein n=1 Tax=Cutibacterium porci TaxID=2605781 RepID=A0A7K0J562_9ACTN|nr:ABC transporter substrate-binding protein [Cutibacterium porci]MSS45081.1 ABC transporter substrate-binding protein [Cutibacterium porci]
MEHPMITMPMTRRTLLTAALLTGLSACSSSDPLDSGNSGSDGGVTVGSANFTESEIIAEVYAQSLEKAGITVKRRMQIGARDVYIKALKDGSVDLVPEYSGNLLQFFQGTSSARDEKSVMAALRKAVPTGMAVGEPSAAQDADSWCVTEKFSQSHNVTSLADLAKLGSLRVGGNPELKERPYGPKGLAKVYGVSDITFTALSDSSGPLTVKALTSGTVDLVDLYTTTPAIKDQHLVVLSDPKHLIVPQNVVPLMNRNVDDKARQQLSKVSQALTTSDLIAMNQRSQGDEKASPATIAKDWLAMKGLT